MVANKQKSCIVLWLVSLGWDDFCICFEASRLAVRPLKCFKVAKFGFQNVHFGSISLGVKEAHNWEKTASSLKSLFYRCKLFFYSLSEAHCIRIYTFAKKSLWFEGNWSTVNRLRLLPSLFLMQERRKTLKF